MNNTQINPENLGSILFNGEYYDRKTAKFYLSQYTQTDKKEEISDSFYNRFFNLFKSK